MPQISIDKKDFIKGVSLTDYIDDGGFSPAKKGNNIISFQGLLKPQFKITDKSTNIADEIIAFTKHWNGTNYFLYGIDSGKNVYQIAASTYVATLKATETNGHTYTQGITDMIVYDNKIYITSTTDIVQWDIISAITVPDWDWWTAVATGDALTATVPHPMARYRGNFYIGNGRYLNSWDGTTHVDQCLTLPADYVITDLIVYNNKLFILANIYDEDPSYITSSRIFVWDSFGEEWINEYSIPFKGICFHIHSEVLHLFGGEIMGYFTGTGVKIIRDNLDTTINGHHQIISFENSMYFVQTSSLMAYSIIAGRGVFSYPVVFATTPTAIAIMEPNYLVSARATNKMELVDTGLSSTSCNWQSNRYDLGNNAYVRKIDIILTSALVASDNINVYLIDSKGVTNNVGSLNYTNDGAIVQKSITGLNYDTYSAQIKINWSVGTPIIKQIIFYYDYTKRPA